MTIGTKEWVAAAVDKAAMETPSGRKLTVTLRLNDKGFGWIEVKGMNPRPFGGSKAHALEIFSELYDELEGGA